MSLPLSTAYLCSDIRPNPSGFKFPLKLDSPLSSPTTSAPGTAATAGTIEYTPHTAGPSEVPTSSEPSSTEEQKEREAEPVVVAERDTVSTPTTPIVTITPPPETTSFEEDTVKTVPEAQASTIDQAVAEFQEVVNKPEPVYAEPEHEPEAEAAAMGHAEPALSPIAEARGIESALGGANENGDVEEQPTIPEAEAEEDVDEAKEEVAEAKPEETNEAAVVEGKEIKAGVDIPTEVPAAAAADVEPPAAETQTLAADTESPAAQASATPSEVNDTPATGLSDAEEEQQPAKTANKKTQKKKNKKKNKKAAEAAASAVEGGGDVAGEAKDAPVPAEGNSMDEIDLN